MDVRTLLLQVKNGEMDLKEAERQLRDLPYEDLGYAKLDHHRELRSGFGETVFCQGKPDEYLAEIYRHLWERDGAVLGTRASREQYELVRRIVPDVTYDPVSRILKAEKPEKQKPRTGLVAVCTGGTADIPVAEEAAQTAEYFGCQVDRIYDVGVAGIHRLLAQRRRLEQANCIVAVAGMEGALGTAVAGLAQCPVIAVPTSVGYGASFHGLSALLTMINSCANGISVVNIDNGYGAGYIATQINRMAVK
ncbi:MAG TPA: nickel pincer cofactor biosynthesis protein LarB [Candidatus Ventrimonas merdavium]|nr:nickel pincer cofactor biosynthesis protein LarB [Candidatus Ventrimonas merdavium]